MTDARDNLNPVSPSQRLRALADGEVAGMPTTPDDEARVGFERDLREAVARSMREVAVPSSLHDRVVKAMRAEPSLTLEIPNARQLLTDAPAPIPFPAPAARMRWWLAVAAAVAVVGGVLITNPPGGRSAVNIKPEVMTQLASFAQAEHQHCAAFDAYFDHKMTARTEADAIKSAIELLTSIPSVLEFRSKELAQKGYEFAGLGPCGVPGKGRSAHLIYKPSASAGSALPPVSLFVQEDKNDLDIPKGKALCREARSGGDCGLRVWRSKGLIYYLVVPASMPSDAEKAFDVPDERISVL